MPFAVFRRHQRKLLAIFAILAMFGFVMADSLPNLLRGGGIIGGGDDSEVARLNFKTIRRSDVARMYSERSRANAFLNRLMPMSGNPIPFGGTSTRELVDAIILEHKADELGMPASVEFGNKWLNTLFAGALRPEMFEKIRREAFENLTGEQLLEDIANQVRIREVRLLPGLPEVTPLDVYQAYRDQQERVSAFAVPFYVADYLDKVAEPSPDELTEYFDRYKDVLPDPARDTPGFKIPHKAQVEYVRIDAAKLARDFREKLTEAELRETYKAREKEFIVPAPELPVKIFAGPGEEVEKLTPRLGDPFREVRDQVEDTLSREKAGEVVEKKFGALRDDVMMPFTDEYLQVLDENKDTPGQTTPPAPGDRLRKAAEAQGLDYEATPVLSRDRAETYGTIGGARVGTEADALAEGRTFAEIFFDPKKPNLYEPTELTDAAGRRYLAWKVADQPARVPALDEVRGEVVRAWKMEKARPLAERDAKQLADQARDKGGDLRAVAGKRTVITTDPITKMTPSFAFSATQVLPSRPNPLPQLPEAGPALRDALFGLEPKQVAVAPNQPKTVYYTLALNRRVEADFDGLYDPFLGQRMAVQNEVYQDAIRAQIESWMARLRAESGLDPSWVPADKAKGENAPNG